MQAPSPTSRPMTRLATALELAWALTPPQAQAWALEWALALAWALEWALAWAPALAWAVALQPLAQQVSFVILPEFVGLRADHSNVVWQHRQESCVLGVASIPDLTCIVMLKFRFAGICMSS